MTHSDNSLEFNESKINQNECEDISYHFNAQVEPRVSEREYMLGCV